MCFIDGINEEAGQLAIFKKKSEGYVGYTYFDNMWVRFFLGNG